MLITPNTTIFYMWMHPIPDSFNRAMYQRPLFWAKSAHLVFLKREDREIPNEIAREVTLIDVPTSLLFGSVFTYIFSAIRLLLKNRAQRHKCIVYTFNDESIIIGLLSKVLGYVWISDIWDDPSLPLFLQEPKFALRRLLVQLKVVLAKRVLKFSDLIVVSTMPEVLASYHLSSRQICAITNGVDIHRTQQVANLVNGKTLSLKSNSVDRELKVVYVGPVRMERASDILIKATAIACQHSSIRIHLILVGPVKDLPYFEGLVKQFSDCPHLKCDILGHKRHDETIAILQNADIAVHLHRRIPNYEYAYAIKLFEYMALGKAIIALDTPATRRIIRNQQNGLLVSLDPDVIASALALLSNDLSLRASLGHKALETVQQYDWDRIHEGLLYCVNSRLGQRVS